MKPCQSVGCSELASGAFCRDCLHDRVTALCGPPGAGKTRYVALHKGPGDVVVDFDLLFQALTMLPLFERDPGAFDAACRTREFLRGYLERSRKFRRGWMILLGARHRERDDLHRSGFRVLLLDPGRATCERRLRDDARRSDGLAKRHLSLLDDWYSQYEPHADDELCLPSAS